MDLLLPGFTAGACLTRSATRQAKPAARHYSLRAFFGRKIKYPAMAWSQFHDLGCAFTRTQIEAIQKNAGGNNPPGISVYEQLGFVLRLNAVCCHLYQEV